MALVSLLLFLFSLSEARCSWNWTRLAKGVDTGACVLEHGVKSQAAQELLQPLAQLHEDIHTRMTELYNGFMALAFLIVMMLLAIIVQLNSIRVFLIIKEKIRQVPEFTHREDTVDEAKKQKEQ